jgi:hypothetical protein
MMFDISAITGLVVATVYCAIYLITLPATTTPNPRKEWWTRENTMKRDAAHGAIIGVPLILWPCAFFIVTLVVYAALDLVVSGVHAL